MEKENREVKSSVFADLFYEDESAEKTLFPCIMRCMRNHCRKKHRLKRSMLEMRFT